MQTSHARTEQCARTALAVMTASANQDFQECTVKKVKREEKKEKKMMMCEL